MSGSWTPYTDQYSSVKLADTEEKFIMIYFDSGVLERKSSYKADNTYRNRNMKIINVEIFYNSKTFSSLLSPVVKGGEGRRNDG